MPYTAPLLYITQSLPTGHKPVEPVIFGKPASLYSPALPAPSKNRPTKSGKVFPPNTFTSSGYSSALI
nr:MAG TPA: hypothetical protein [Caudoviricetes sp.]